MKKCTWCGKEYSDELEACLIDGEPLSGPEQDFASKSSVPQLPELNTDWGNRRQHPPLPSLTQTPQWLDLDQLEGAFTWAEGYSRPNWKLIRHTIRRRVPVEHQENAWTEAVLQWAEQLRKDLGGEYSVRRSPEFVLLSAQDVPTAEDLLRFAERTLDSIYDWLKEAAWNWVHGKHVLLLFADQEDYYQYVAYFFGEGLHPASGGCLISRGYVHIALPYDVRTVRRVLSHELVHNSVVHLPLPAWLNEGLAVSFERSSANQGHILDGDLRERHYAFWNPETIQRFWAGVSFREPGEPNALSYSLAEILTHLLLSEANQLPAFVQAARWEDAGQTAAWDVLGADLGKVAATFLGPGDWRPNRKAILACQQGASKVNRD